MHPTSRGLFVGFWHRAHGQQALEPLEGEFNLPAAPVELEHPRRAHLARGQGGQDHYEVGHQEIVRQRSRAEAALGPRYDLRAFNDAVVLGGNVPLDVLAKNVDLYVEAARRG